jgi:hypothetical protein
VPLCFSARINRTGRPPKGRAWCRLSSALPENTWKHSSSDVVSTTRRSSSRIPTANITSAVAGAVHSIAITSSTANRRIRGALIDAPFFL